MNDFTKIKLINSLIDVVEHFYLLKNSKESKETHHLKGFCEGMAYTLIEMEYLSSDEAATILKGLGKKEQFLEPEEHDEPSDEAAPFINAMSQALPQDDLDIPTFIRKNKDAASSDT